MFVSLAAAVMAAHKSGSPEAVAEALAVYREAKAAICCPVACEKELAFHKVRFAHKHGFLAAVAAAAA